MFEFRYDERKNESNQRKHGISFPEAKKLWEKPYFEFPIKDAVRIFGEMRYMVLGEIDERRLAAVISYQGGAVRLISVRDQNINEQAKYADSIEKTKKSSEAKG